MSERIFRGLTLIELLMVLTVAAILATAAIPFFFDLTARQRLKGAADTLYGHLQHARLLAAKENTPITVSFRDSGPASGWCYGLSDTGPCLCQTTGSCRLGSGPAIVVGSADFRDTGLKNNFYRDEVTFNPLLGASNGGTIILSANGQNIRVVVSTLGRVRTCSDEVTGYPPC